MKDKQKKVEDTNQRIKILENVLKEKKIIETNFCSVEKTDDENVIKFNKDSIGVNIHNFEVFFTKNEMIGKKMISDNGAPLSIVGKPWLEIYLNENDLSKDELVSEDVNEHFKFGPSRVYHSTKRYKIPLMVCDKEDRKVKMAIKAYEVNVDIPLLCGKNTLKEWGSSTIHNKDILKCNNIIENAEVEFDLEQTPSGHDALKLELIKEDSIETTVAYINEEVHIEDGNISEYKKVKRIHEVTNHKREENMIYAYRNAGALTDDVHKMIKKVIENCKVCKKFKRSLGTPKVALPKVLDFNEVVALDLKQMG